MQVTTVISDALLAASCFFVASKVQNKPSAVVGLAIVGIAAVLGTIRFAGVKPIEPFHDIASFIGGAVGYPLVLFAFTLGPGGLISLDFLGLGSSGAGGKSVAGVKFRNPFDKQTLALTGLLLAGAVAAQLYIPSAFLERYTLFVVSPASTAAMTAAIKRQHWILVAAIAVFGAVGAYGTTGTAYGPILKVDVFHAGLVAANVLFWKALASW